jgi:hypothetical protein
MTAFSIQMGNTVRTIATAVAFATLVLTTSAQAADSTDRIIPPNPADVAILRGLLALQNPSLRQGAAAQAMPATNAPALTTEPQPSSQTPAATEGEACVAPADGSAPTCGFSAETSAVRTARLGNSFRDSLDRAMAAAGFDNDRL